MKSASFPSLRVAPELRHAAEDVLIEGESLSSFVEQSIRANIARRRLQNEFISRGLAARDQARATGEYFSADEVHETLDRMLQRASGRKSAA